MIHSGSKCVVGTKICVAAESVAECLGAEVVGVAKHEAIYPIVANASNGVELQAIAKRVETLTVKHPIMRDTEVSTF